MAATESETDGIGKDPTEVDEAQPDNEQFEQFLDEQIPEADQDGSEAEPESDLPSREELWAVVQDQQHLIEKQSTQIEDLQKRVSSLESQIDEVEQEADTLEEVAEQFRNGEIGGEAGADFLREFVSLPPNANSKVNARSKLLFFRIIEEHRVGKPVRSKDVVNWLNLHDSANPSVVAKRIMERVKQHREDGYFIGTVELGKYRGENAIWLKRE